MREFRHNEQITVPGSGTATFTLRNVSQALSGLTIWAVSGGRTIANLTFQPQINGQDFGGSTAIVGAVALDVVYAGGSDKNVIPGSGANSPADPFNFTVLITNADASDALITIYAIGMGGDH
jgi:hypothetical protein